MFGRFKLRDADEMFGHFFDRWYDDDSRKLRGFPATRPDMRQMPEFVGKTICEICPINDEAASNVKGRIDTMCAAAAADWPTYLAVKQPIDLGWVKAFDTHFNLKRVSELARQSDASDFSNDYLVTVCQFGTVLGLVMIQRLPRLNWLPSWPYWESAVFDGKTGHVIPVFHWAVKKFSSYGLDDGFAGKVVACIEILQNEDADNS